MARSPDELSLSRGDRIELIERDDDFGDGWYLGRHMQNGETGLFPEGRVTRKNYMRTGVTYHDSIYYYSTSSSSVSRHTKAARRIRFHR